MTLIGVTELARLVDSPDVRVVDVRWYLGRPGAGRAAFESGHIAGAIHLDLDLDLSAADGAGRHPLPTPATFRDTLMRAGIGSGHRVVAYDDAGGTNAARLWWMLDNLGHTAGVAVLDGGLQAWLAAGYPLTTESTAWPVAKDLELASGWSRVIHRDELANRLGTLTLLDARAPERYRGEVEPIDPAAGHIPTAISAPTAGNLGVDGRFLESRALRHRFDGLVLGDAPVVISCGSGTTACHNALAMRVALLPDPILYPGSFSDWSTAGMPVATGDSPGGPMPRPR